MLGLGFEYAKHHGGSEATRLKKEVENFQVADCGDAPAATPRRTPLPEMGLTVRRLRRQRQLTLQDLSRQAGISIGMLSQMERGIAAPSLRSLLRVAEALEVPVGWFFDPPRAATDGPAWVQRRPQRRTIELDAEGITKELITPPGDGAIELLLVTIRPGGSSGAAYTHAGEDAGMVREGQVHVEVDGEVAELAAGDAFRFASTRPHRFWNASDAPAVLVWALTPPFY